MTAYIDNITIVGTPEEIQEFIELRNKPEGRITFPNLPQKPYEVTYWGGYEPSQPWSTNPDGSITISGSYIANSDNVYFKNDNENTTL